MSNILVRPQEQLLIDQAAQLPGERLLCNSAGRGQFAAEWAKRHPMNRASCFFLDLHLRDEAAAINTNATNIEFVCQADPPPHEIGVVGWCISKQGDAELTRELLQTAYERLRIGGLLVAASDNPQDTWLQDELRKLFPKVTRQPGETAVLYRATKLALLKKAKNFSCEFAFRDGERLIHLRTRPGVFSHRKLDVGARALMEAMQIEPHQRVLDLGCGSGAVGVAAALRAADVQVLAVDSNPRAIESTRWAAERNGLPGLIARLNADGSAIESASYDLALANPPYYSNYRLADLFVAIAARALRPGGRLMIVTKRPNWYEEILPTVGFEVPLIRPSRAYWIVEAVRTV